MRRAIAALTMLLPALLSGQMQPSAILPATVPAQSGSNLPSAQSSHTAAAAKAGQTTVAWATPLLTIHAAGEGLPSILRQVARATGMKVTGGVPDEPVFGNYGPGPVQDVLASLFEGLSVNVLLVNGSPTQPKDLILTARTGGATPPMPSQTIAVDTDAATNTNPADANLAQPRPGRHTSPDSFQGFPQPVPDAASQNLPVTPQGVGPAVPLNDNSNATTGGTTPATDANGTPQSPNGVRTPEQIFEELRKRQQQTSKQQ